MLEKAVRLLTTAGFLMMVATNKLINKSWAAKKSWM